MKTLFFYPAYPAREADPAHPVLFAVLDMQNEFLFAVMRTGYAGSASPAGYAG